MILNNFSPLSEPLTLPLKSPSKNNDFTKLSCGPNEIMDIKSTCNLKNVWGCVAEAEDEDVDE